jgi:hypothetical protein
LSSSDEEEDERPKVSVVTLDNSRLDTQANNSTPKDQSSMAPRAPTTTASARADKNKEIWSISTLEDLKSKTRLKIQLTTTRQIRNKIPPSPKLIYSLHLVE